MKEIDLFNAIFNDCFTNVTMTPMEAYLASGIKIYTSTENEKSYSWECPVPGLEAKDISVEVKRDSLVVTLLKGSKFCLKDSTRTMVIPSNVNKKGIESKVLNGVLIILLPKKEEDTFKIEVK